MSSGPYMTMVTSSNSRLLSRSLCGSTGTSAQTVELPVLYIRFGVSVCVSGYFYVGYVLLVISSINFMAVCKLGNLQEIKKLVWVNF